jgi:tRNA-2-methylthio-N6-dimethylallyladenosine synthase
LYTRLGDIKGMGRVHGHAPMVVVAGCVAQQEGQRLTERSDLIDVVVGTQRVKMLPMLVSEARDRAAVAPPLIDISTPYEEPSFALGLTRRSDPIKAYVTIIEGCNDYCSYCVVPYTRGHERMRPKSEILAEVGEAVDSGRQEIQLLGQIVNHYLAPDDPSCDFPALLEAVNAVPGVRRIRFASPHPRHASERLIAAVRDLPAVCKHMHLPVQSGSTAVLERMRRRHTREQYLELVARIREAIPNIQLSTDMIVGFPGETDAEYEETLTLTEAVRFHSMFSFKYSERPNTLASKRMANDVPEAVKTRRIMGLQQLQRRVQCELHEGAVGATMEVLIDSVSRRREWELSGRTTGNTVVNFAGGACLVGQFASVTIRRAGAYSLWGELVQLDDVAGGVHSQECRC